ncbi:MAG: hypothetical protein JWR46_3117, partial [Mycobacterium sp.]|nr:hypothetical protein [Mycobacterium sp.]
AYMMGFIEFYPKQFMEMIFYKGNLFTKMA